MQELEIFWENSRRNGTAHYNGSEWREGLSNSGFFPAGDTFGSGTQAVLEILKRWVEDHDPWGGRLELGDKGYQTDYTGQKKAVFVANHLASGKGFFCGEVDIEDHFGPKEETTVWIQTLDEVAEYLEGQFPTLKTQSMPMPQQTPPVAALKRERGPG